MLHSPIDIWIFLFFSPSQCYIDGPYGTCARELLKSEHAVLIGAGIGVTPMASVLQSVWYKFNEARVECPCCQHTWYFEKTTNEMKLKKVGLCLALSQRRVEYTVGKGEITRNEQFLLFHSVFKRCILHTRKNQVFLGERVELLYLESEQ